MSAFSAALASMNDTLMDTFGDTVQITLSNNTTLMVPGVFSRERSDIEANRAESWRYTVLVKTADVVNFDIVKRNTITVGGVTYTIIDILPDDGGMTTYVLRQYA